MPTPLTAPTCHLNCETFQRLWHRFCTLLKWLPLSRDKSSVAEAVLLFTINYIEDITLFSSCKSNIFTTDRSIGGGGGGWELH